MSCHENLPAGEWALCPAPEPTIWEEITGFVTGAEPATAVFAAAIFVIVYILVYIRAE